MMRKIVGNPAAHAIHWLAHNTHTYAAVMPKSQERLLASGRLLLEKRGYLGNNRVFLSRGLALAVALRGL